MNSTSPPRFTAAAGTKLAGASSSGYRHNLPTTKEVYSLHLRPPRDIAGSSKTHCPKFLTAARPVRAVFIPIVVGRPLRPTKDNGLGRPLPLPTT
jgi:hypothetical protein